jgi:50S ribosomal protein L16 3-hydroxylase
LLETLDDDRMLAEWFAQFMTAPKYPMLVDETGELRSASVKHNDGTVSRYENGLKD